MLRYCYFNSDYGTSLAGKGKGQALRQAIGDSVVLNELTDDLMINDDFFIFILQSRESDGGAMHRTNPDSLGSCPCFPVFCLSFASDIFNLLLVGFHLTEIIVKHLIQRRNNEAWVGVEPSSLRSWPS